MTCEEKSWSCRRRTYIILHVGNCASGRITTICFSTRLQEAQQKELDYCHDLEHLQAEMDSRVGRAEQGQEDALYDGVNLLINLATKEDIIRHYRLQLAKLEVSKHTRKHSILVNSSGGTHVRRFHRLPT